MPNQDIDALKQEYEQQIQTLQAQSRTALNHQRQALTEEFGLQLHATKDVAERAEMQLRNSVCTAAERIIYLAEHADKDAVSLAASRWIYENFGNMPLKAPEEDTLKKMLAELTPETP